MPWLEVCLMLTPPVPSSKMPWATLPPRWTCRAMDCSDPALYTTATASSRSAPSVDINGLMKHKTTLSVFIGNILSLILNLVPLVHNKWKGFVALLACLICDPWLHDFYLLDALCLWDINAWFAKLAAIYISTLILNLLNKYIKPISLIGIYIKYLL